ncbi:hypothetical protein EMPS_09916 [Entomortierella parvispora]|uniref:Arm-like repeat domain-containing protein n=1 Tax=Entomortierella parvispora TaxID=205924 RepID=A0A9P3M0U0_9FUNG|nr:hypothetical protein EMPS_09916 [Entomortierella parvispora]
MVGADIGEVDRINIHGPLTDLLRESESTENPYLVFQAAYATQALLNVSDDDNIWRAGFRRGWLTLKAGTGFAKVLHLAECRMAFGETPRPKEGNEKNRILWQPLLNNY